MLAPDGFDLLQVMKSMNELKAPPLLHGERAQNHVADRTLCAKEMFPLGRQTIDLR